MIRWILRDGIRWILTLALTALMIGFLTMVWKSCRHQAPKTPRELAADSAAHYSKKAQLHHDSATYYHQQYQRAQAQHDSLVARIFRGDPALDRQRDSLRAVIRERVRAGLTGHGPEVRIPETNPPPTPKSP